MDLLMYEAIDSTDQQARDLSRAASELRDVQDQASAWLWSIVRTVVPGWSVLGGQADGMHG